MAKTPITVKICAAGMVLIYIAAKVHMFMTFGSDHYLAQHWLFWAAMGIWMTLFALVDFAVRKFCQNHPRTTEIPRAALPQRHAVK